MSDIHLNQEFTTDVRSGGTVSIALMLSEDPDELWRRAFNELIDDQDWVGESHGVILGHTFPHSYDDTCKLELRTHLETIDEALDSVARTIDKVNQERAEELEHGRAKDGTTEAHARVQRWFDARVAAEAVAAPTG